MPLLYVVIRIARLCPEPPPPFWPVWRRTTQDDFRNVALMARHIVSFLRLNQRIPEHYKAGYHGGQKSKDDELGNPV